MTFADADDGFLSSTHCFIFPSTSPPPSSPQPAIGMHPTTTTLGTHHWPLNPSPSPPPDLWSPSPYRTSNRCTTLSSSSPPSSSSSSGDHDPPTFSPACIWAVHPAHNNLAPRRSSLDQLRHVLPSPPPTDSDPKHTVPLPALSEDSPSHVAGISSPPSPPSSSTSFSRPSSPNPLTLRSCNPAPRTQIQDPDKGPPLTSHPSATILYLLPPSPPPSLPMVPQALPEPTTPCCTPSEDEDAHDDTDADVETGAALHSESRSSSSSSSFDEPPESDLLTPLSPILDLLLDDTDPRPAGTLEVSTLLSRSLVSPLPRLATSGVQATERDTMTLPCGANPSSILDLDSRVESQCGQLRPSLVVPPSTVASARFSMFHTFMNSPNFDGFPSSDGFLGHSQPASGGKLFVDSSPLKLILSDPASTHVLPQLTLLGQPVPFRRRLSLSYPSPQDSAADTRDVFVSHFHRTGTSPPSGATLDMSHCNSLTPCGYECTTQPSAVTSDLVQRANGTPPDPAPPSPLLELGGSSIGWPDMSEIAGLGPGPMDVCDADFSDDASPDAGDLEQDATPSSPMPHILSELHDDDEDFGSSSVPPLSPSRRSFADLPEDTAVDEQSTSPPQSPLLVGQPLLTLPGAEPDNSLITADAPVSASPSPPRGSGLGLFLPIQAASSNQAEASEAHAIEPNLDFSPAAIARVDSREFEKLTSVRRRTWVLERKAKEDEVFHAKRAEYLAGRLSVAPPVPSKLADFDERGGVSAGADADKAEGPPAEPAQLDESDEKTIRTWLLFIEARRAEARRIRKREKERGRELQALLRLKLGEDPDTIGRAARGAGGGRAAKVVKPGKTAIVSMPQLVARMMMKRRDTPRPFSPRKHDARIPSPLSRFEPTAWDESGSPPPHF